VATDIAEGMLAQTRRLAAEYDHLNMALAMAEAENLPFVSGSLDLVSCRQAAHHFHDLPRAVAEIRRVLKPGGAFLLSDTVAPEGDPEAGWLNDVELRRDPSHQRDRRPSEWLALLDDAGLQVTHKNMAKVHLEFNDWVLRSATPHEMIEPLRRDFLSAKPSVVKAFGIRPEGERIHFHWDVLVVRAVRN
jgi:ubiquinone/menaquinone biosynthesis C-methylase UbiE